MKVYVIYDENTGNILQTHTKYVLGNEEPVACTEKELLELAAADYGADVKLAVAQVPDGFDPRVRNQKLVFDQKAADVKVELVSASQTRKKSKRSK